MFDLQFGSKNPPTRTHANRNYVVVMIMQIIVATGACAMGGCNTLAPGVNRGRECGGIPALPPLIVIPGRESTLLRAEASGEMYQVVKHSPLVLA